MTNDTASSSLIDLNRADVDTLTTLPGVGPKLAARIVRFRKEVHPFGEPIEITAVPGISENMYRQLADRVSVSSPDERAVLEVEKVSVRPDAWEVTRTEAEISAGEPVDRVGGRADKLTEESAEEPAVRSEAKIAPAPLGVPSSEAREKGWGESPTPGPQPAPIGCLRQLLLMLVGALGGALLALLAMQSINGTLDIALHPRLLQLDDEVSALESQDEVLNAEIRELRTRLDQTEALTGRLQNAEADLQTLDEALSKLEEQVANLEQGALQVQETVDQIRTAMDRFDAFLNGLEDLLLSIQGTAVPTTTVTSAATPSPTPSATPADTSTVVASPTATRTPTPGS
jgi:hypothetical protein